MTTNWEQELIAKAASRQALIGVVGLGYVGLPLVAEMAAAGYRVLGFDVTQRVVDHVNQGVSHVQDVPSERLAKFVKAGRVTATTDLSRMGEPDCLAICVPTPLSKSRDPDVSYILAATASVAKTIRPGQLVVLESTTYPGTTRELMLPALEQGGLTVGRDVFLAFSADPTRFDKMLARMFGVSGDGLHDQLTDFSTPVSGAYYFAPSLQALASQFS